MKIISALGGGGSSFVLRSLDSYNYTPCFSFNTYQIKLRLEKHPELLKIYRPLLRLLGCYTPSLMILKRPDSFWTDWNYHKTGIYNPSALNFQEDLERQKTYLIQTQQIRSEGISITATDITTTTLTDLVASYLQQLQNFEAANRNSKIVLLSAHWGEYGIFKELGIETIYLIRDPFNSIISHSKEIRHQKDYKKRGLNNINTPEWLDTYLEGPHHYWINHAKTALEHHNAVIIRYNYFAEDWKKVAGLPDISDEFVYKTNDVHKILTGASISYIYHKTKNICDALGLGEICASYVPS